MIAVLFVCSRNRLRSPTAEQVFSAWSGVACRSAGVDHDADVPLDAETVRWARLIFVMEKSHLAKLRQRFRAELDGQRVIVLGIPDDYDYMDPALVGRLEREVGPYLKRLGAHEP